MLLTDVKVCLLGMPKHLSEIILLDAFQKKVLKTHTSTHMLHLLLTVILVPASFVVPRVLNTRGTTLFRGKPPFDRIHGRPSENTDI